MKSKKSAGKELKSESISKKVETIKPEVVAHTPTDSSNMPEFPVVGIGTSAGGLEALQEFFENIPAQPEAAFIVVQHLSPDHKSFMDELLSHYTKIPIEVVKDNTKIDINRIYLIPPKMNMTIEKGVLHLKEVVDRGLNLPIDIFFRSLAEDQQHNAVAIILSGTGSDGSLGIRAIKEFGGMTLVQSEESAKFDGMPKSTIATGMVDMIYPPAQLAQKLISFLSYPLFVNENSTKENILIKNQNLYNRVLAILRQSKDVDFSAYKQNTIIRRLEKRVFINKFTDISDYVEYLSKNPQEIEILFNEILIGVTKFFRDENVFELLEEVYLAELFNSHTGKDEIRIWVAGCSTGEEAYTIAILIKEYMIKNHIFAGVKIFATDIDERSLKYASTGFYPGNIAADVPAKYLAKYFFPHGNGYQINADLRSMIIFAPQNAIEEPPFYNLDMISCRNLLIYINPEMQNKVLTSFYGGLRANGLLLLGSSESLGKLADGFNVLDSKSKIFKKRAGYKLEADVGLPRAILHLNKPSAIQNDLVHHLTQDNRQLLEVLEEIDNAFLPPSVVTDLNYNIIYMINDAGRFLRMAQGRMSTNLLKMLPSEACVLVSSLLRRAGKSDKILSSEILIDKKRINARCKRINVVNGDSVYYYVCFEEPVERVRGTPLKAVKSTSAHYQYRIDDLEREISQKDESLQAAVEELETSNEELQTSNEELVASNEELQSTNEELQSVNEELYTVNTEHMRKIEEITELNADYDNLLSNTQIGTLFLDTNLVIRKISKIACEITNILQTDVGRPLHHLSLNTLYSDFTKDVDKVNVTKKRIEREFPFNGKFYFMRIVPYLIKKDTIKGVIVTFVDLTESKLSIIAHKKMDAKKKKKA